MGLEGGVTVQGDVKMESYWDKSIPKSNKEAANALGTKNCRPQSLDLNITEGVWNYLDSEEQVEDWTLEGFLKSRGKVKLKVGLLKRTREKGKATENVNE